MSSYPGQRPRSAIFADTLYQQGGSGESYFYSIYKEHGYPYNGDYRFAAWWVENSTGAPVASRPSTWHKLGGWQSLYRTAGGGQGWYMHGGRRWWNAPAPDGSGMEDFTDRTGNNFVKIGWTIAMYRVDPVLPTWPQGHPLGPRVSQKFNNTLVYTLPEWGPLPHGGVLLIDLNIAWFNNDNCLDVTMPPNDGMLRNWSYPVEAAGYSGGVDRGGVLTVDYHYFGNRLESTIPPRVKAFGGPNTPAWCQSFSFLVNGYHMGGSGVMASTIAGGPATV